MKNKLILLALSTSLLTACDDSKNSPSFNPEKQTAIIVNKAFGEGSQIALATVSEPRTLVDGFLDEESSDYTVEVHGEYFYHIGRKDIDTIQRFHIDSPNQGYYPNNGYVLRNDGEATSSNPQDIAFVSDQLAVITFLGKTEAWVVNPEAQTFEDFKIRELDLSDYAFNDGIPDAKNVEIINGRVFISMQQVDFDNGYSKEQAYVAVFDTNTWDEIDTSPEDAATKAIALTIRNPLDIQIADNQLYVHGMDYSTYVGGLEVINPNTLKSTVIYRDNEETGRIFSLTMVSATQAYAIDYAGWKNNSFKSISINNNEVTITPIAGFENTYLTALGTDGANNIWLGLGSVAAPVRQAGVQVFTSTGELSGEVLTTELDPDKITFLTKD
ncbi:MAG: hypothetical protein V7765_12395 [Oleispira sp.]